MADLREENALNLYESIKDQYELGTYEEFTKTLTDGKVKARHDLFRTLKDDGYEVGAEYRDFHDALFAETPLQQPEVPGTAGMLRGAAGKVIGTRPLAPTDTAPPAIQEAMTKPLIKITSDEPIPEKAVGRGLLRGAGQLIEGFTTAENVLSILGMGSTSKAFQELSETVFKGLMTVGAADAAIQTGELIKEGQYGEAAASGVQMLGQAAMAHGPMIRKELARKYGKKRADQTVDVLQKQGLKDALDGIDQALADDVEVSALSEVTKAERAAAIEKQLTDLDRVRQSRRGYELLREELAARERATGGDVDMPFRGKVTKPEPVEPKPLVKKRAMQTPDELINQKLEQARDAGLPITEPIITKQQKIEAAKGPGGIRGLEQAEFIAQQRGVVNLITDGLESTFRALRELHGGDRTGIQPYSDYNYRAAKPHFEAAWKSYKEAGSSFAHMSKDMIDKYGPDVIPYLRALEGEVLPVQLRADNSNDQVSNVKGNEAIVAKKPYLHSSDKVDPWAVAREVQSIRNKTGQDNVPFDKFPAERVQRMVQKVRDMMDGKREMDPNYAQALDNLTNPAMQIKLDDLHKVAPETPIVQRKGSGKDNPYKRPPITAGDFAGLQELNAKVKKAPKFFENPIYTVERWGKWAKETIFDPLADAEHRSTEQLHGIDMSFKQTVKDARKMPYKVTRKDGTVVTKKGLPGNWRDRVGNHALSRRVGGKQALLAQGDKIIEWADLTPGEQSIYNWARAKDGFFDQMYHQTNAARKASGDKPFPYTEDYITFARVMLDMDALGQQPFHKGSVGIDPWIHPNTPSFPFAKEAKLNPRPVDTNFERLVMNYAKKSTDYIHKGPVIAKQREMLKQFKDSRGEPVLNLKTDNPELHKWWSDYLDFNAGVTRPKFTPAVDRALNKLNKNLAFSLLSANVHAFIIQPSAYRNVFSQIGTKYAAKGVASMFDPTMRDFAFNKLGVRERSFDVNIFDASRPYHGAPGYLGRGAAGATKLLGGGKKAQQRAVKGAAKTYEVLSETKRKAGEAGLAPLKILDKETAIAAANGAYYYAKESLGYSESQARRYARDTVIKTQASATPANLAPIQRDAVGKTLTLFQTFTINEWNFVKRDVLGLGKNMPAKQRAARIARFAVGTAVANGIFQAMGTNSPFPEPIAAYQNAIDRGLDGDEAMMQVGLELLQPVPMIGGTKYGSTPLGAGAETISDVTSVISGDPFAPSALELGGRLTGMVGTQQLSKMARQKAKVEREVAKRAKSTKSNRRQRSSGRTRRERTTR